MNKVLLITLLLIAPQSVFGMEEDNNSTDKQVQLGTHQAAQIAEKDRLAAIADRDRMMHDFLHDHSTFQKMWGKQNSTGYTVLPKQLKGLIAQQVIAPVMAMLTKKMNVPYRTFQDPINNFEFSTMKFNSAGDMLVTIPARHHVAKIWNIATGECTHTLAHEATFQHPVYHPNVNFPNRIISAQFNRAGNMLATTAQDDTCKLWDLHKGSCVSIPTGFHPNCVTFNRSGTLFAVATNENNAKIYITQNHTLLHTFEHTSAVVEILFNREGDLVATVEAHGTIKIWDIITGKCLHTLPSNVSVWTVVFNQAGNMLVITYFHGTDATLYDLTTKTWRKLEDVAAVRSAQFNQTDDLIVTAVDNDTAKIWDVASGECLRTLTHRHLKNATFTQKGNMILTLSHPGTAKIWDVASGTCLYTFSDLPYSAEFNQVGNFITTNHRCGIAKIWRIDLHLAAMKFLQNDLTLEQAMLLNCIYQTCLNNKLLEKRGQKSDNKLDFNTFPHLQEYFMQLPEGLRYALQECVVLKQEPTTILNSNN